MLLDQRVPLEQQEPLVKPAPLVSLEQRELRERQEQRDQLVLVQRETPVLLVLPVQLDLLV